ncbi:MAG TPA: amidase, partial [Candidatus Dormibacteraeota bacterium]|nr:amidase [Candidatus Dormibacteraeota bacterium]
MNLTTDRRSFLAYFSSLGLTSTLFPGVLWARLSEGNTPEAPAPQLTAAAPPLTKEMLREAAAVAGLEFTDEQLDKMLKGV